MTYRKVKWPDYQKYQEKSWFEDEAYIARDDQFSPAAPVAFIPENRLDPDIKDDDYIVTRLEVHEQPVLVRSDEAETPVEAVDIVGQGGGEILSSLMRYHTDLSEYSVNVHWKVEKDDELVANPKIH